MRNSILRLIAPIFILAAMASCKGDADQIDLVELDLMSYGMPVVIMAPEDPVVETKKLGSNQITTVKKDGGFYIDIFESNAESRKPEDIKARMLRDVQSNPYFQKVLMDEPNGFTYEIAVDTNYINYGFRYLKLQGDKEYIYQSGIGKKFTLDQVEHMYKAVSTPQ